MDHGTGRTGRHQSSRNMGGNRWPSGERCSWHFPENSYLVPVDARTNQREKGHLMARLVNFNLEKYDQQFMRAGLDRMEKAMGELQLAAVLKIKKSYEHRRP